MAHNNSTPDPWQLVPAHGRDRQEHTIQQDAQVDSDPRSLLEYVSRDDLIQRKGHADCHGIIGYQGYNDSEPKYRVFPANKSLKAKQAVERYHDHSSAQEHGGVELLPRLDCYT